ncbi:DUF4406 domain-containing protein [bacterium 1xD42-67]|nr:DUF4406 domain-containing protein [bacterium 1xD42-67]
MASKRNSEGYYDLTAYEALVKIEREAKRTRTYRPLVYVCSPLSGDIAANQKNARRYCRSVVERGGIPLAPHLYFPQFMDDGDETERDLCLFMDIVLLTKCAELWVFGERISKGMSMEIEKAKRKGQPIRWFDSNCKEVFQ